MVRRWSGLTAAVQMKDGVLLEEREGWKVGHKSKELEVANRNCNGKINGALRTAERK